LGGEKSDGWRGGENGLGVVGLLELVEEGLLVLKQGLVFGLELSDGLF